MSIGANSDSLASSAAFSAVPPTPIPNMPGGHQPAPIVGKVLSTQSAMLSLGFNIAILALFSEPPPLAAKFTSIVLPGISSIWITAGVLSFVFLRAPAGSSRIEGRSTLSGKR